MNATDPKTATMSGETGASQRPHPRPVRLPRETKLPLAVRKELLLTRAALERYDFAQAVNHVRGNASRVANLRHWLPGTSSPWMRVLGLAKDHPVLSSAISLAMPLLRKTPLARWAWKLSKVGLVAGAGYWAYQRWNEVQTADTETPASSAPATEQDH